MVEFAEISKIESKFIDDRMEELKPLFGFDKQDTPVWVQIPCEVDEVVGRLPTRENNKHRRPIIHEVRIIQKKTEDL